MPPNTTETASFNKEKTVNLLPKITLPINDTIKNKINPAKVPVVNPFCFLKPAVTKPDENAPNAKTATANTLSKRELTPGTLENTKESSTLNKAQTKTPIISEIKNGLISFLKKLPTPSI